MPSTTVKCLDCQKEFRIPEGGFVPTEPRCYRCGADRHAARSWWVPKVGDRVRFPQGIDRFPHFALDRGETGIISEIGEDTVDIHVDRDLGDACAEWNNCVVISTDDGYNLGGEHDEYLMTALLHYCVPVQD